MTYIGTILDPKRAALAIEVMGQPSMPLTDNQPFMALLPKIGSRAVFLVDVEALTDEQRERLIEQQRRIFGVSREEAENELDCRGFPLLAQDVEVTEV